VLNGEINCEKLNFHVEGHALLHPKCEVPKNLPLRLYQNAMLLTYVLSNDCGALLLAKNLHYHGSLARVDICFYKKQRLPRSELHAPINHWQGLVRRQQHGTQV